MLFLLLTAGILNQADRQIIALLKPMMEVDLGWNDAGYGTLVAVFQLAAAAAFPFAGWFVDRVEPKYANAFAVGSWSIAAALHGLATSFGQFLAARFSLGASEALGTPITVKTLSVLFADAGQRSLYFGLIGGIGCVGAIIIPLSISHMAVSLGWRLTFILAGGCGLVWAAAWYITARRVRWRWQETASLTEPSVRWRDIWLDRRTWAISGTKVLSDQAWWLLLFWIPDYLHRSYHLGVLALAVPVAIIYGLSSAGSLLGGWLPAHLSRRQSMEACRRPIMTAAALTVPAVLWVPFAGNLWIAVLLFGLTLASHQVFSVNLFGVITDVMPETKVGRVTGVAAFWGNVTGMVMVQGTGLALARGGSYLPIFLLTAAAYAAAPFVLHLFLPIEGAQPGLGRADQLQPIALRMPGE